MGRVATAPDGSRRFPSGCGSRRAYRKESHIQRTANINMNTSLSIYTAYFLASLGMTIWVARTLHKNGRLFLVEAFSGNQDLADSVNHLLLVGFYLINVGFILLFLRVGPKPADMVEGVEYISTKLGIVILVLGGMHFFNMFNFARMRKKWLALPPPPILNATTGKC